MQIGKFKDGVGVFSRPALRIKAATFYCEMGGGTLFYPHFNGAVRQVQDDGAHFGIMLAYFLYPESHGIEGDPDAESKCFGVGECFRLRLEVMLQPAQNTVHLHQLFGFENTGQVWQGALFCSSLEDII